MSKAKAKSGTGKGTGTGTGKKGWNRWKTSANKKKAPNHMLVKASSIPVIQKHPVNLQVTRQKNNCLSYNPYKTYKIYVCSIFSYRVLRDLYERNGSYRYKPLAISI